MFLKAPCKIIKIADTPCKNKRELLRHEQRQIDLAELQGFNVINERRARSPLHESLEEKLEDCKYLLDRRERVDVPMEQVQAQKPDWFSIPQEPIPEPIPEIFQGIARSLREQEPPKQKPKQSRKRRLVAEEAGAVPKLKKARKQSRKQMAQVIDFQMV